MNVKYGALLGEMSREFDDFAVIRKDTSCLMKFIYAATLMRFWNPTFMTNFTTTLFGKVYMPQSFMDTDSGYLILRHERVHLRDSKRWPVLFQLSYLLFLPAVFTMRAFWEYRAYCESLLAIRELNGDVLISDIEWCADQFCSSSYLFMFPFRKVVMKLFTGFLLDRGIRVIYLRLASTS